MFVYLHSPYRLRKNKSEKSKKKKIKKIKQGNQNNFEDRRYRTIAREFEQNTIRYMNKFPPPVMA